MGLITSLIEAKAQKDTQAKLSAIQGLTAAMQGAPTPEAREWAATSIADLAAGDILGHKKGKDGKTSAGGGAQGNEPSIFHKILSGMAGQMDKVNPTRPSAGMRNVQSEIGATKPAQMQLTPEQQQAQEDKDAQAKAATQAKIDAAKRKQQIADNQQAYEEAFQRNLKAYPQDPVKAREIAEEEVYNKNKTVEPKAASVSKPTKQYVQLPDGSTHLAWVVPGQPGGTLVDTGEQLPEGWQVTAPPSGADARTTYAQLLRSLHDKYPALGKEQLAAMAGDEYQRKYGLEIGKAEQSIAINEVLSGVGGGAYNPKVPAAGGATDKPKLTPKTSGGTASSTSPATTSAAPAITPKDSTDMSVFFADALGNTKATGPEKVRLIKGREAFKKITGLDPVAFETLIKQDAGTAKAIIDTTERQASVLRVNEVLKTFGDEAVKRAQEVAQHEPDAPVLKKPIRELTSATVGNPAYARFLVAWNGFQRQYSTLTAGAGGLSRAQLPVGIADKVDKILDPNATLETVIQNVDQVKIEGNKEIEGFRNAQKDMAAQIDNSLKKGGSGAAAASGAGASGGGGEDQQYQGHTYHRDKPGEPWKLVK